MDYSGEGVRITTNQGIFSCKYVIAGFPLGVLKSNQIQFSPQLPYDVSKTIKNMGSGVANKIYVSF